MELATGTPQKGTPVTNTTGSPIVVSVAVVKTSGTKNGQPPSLVSSASQSIAPGSSATTVPFKVQNIGSGDWIQVKCSITVAGQTYTLMLQVH